MENTKKKSLVERYEIPIHHLDFKYIETCKDAREMEKIVHILRSNEEGYFPDLTKCAEEKLKELKPQSRLFRVEEHIKGREALEPNELKPIYDWNQDIKKADKKLRDLVLLNISRNSNVSDMPPIRKGGSILQIENGKVKSLNSESNKQETPSIQRIRSTDYNKWDKYDAEEEILRLDLTEEREQEEVERKNRLEMEKYTKKPLTITEITEEDSPKWLNLSDIEKDKLSEEYRIRGNEYFRCKEYDMALLEYTCAIDCCPETAVAAYNNRALTYFKLQNFLKSIKDCEQVLRLEPTNLKAHLRLAKANYAFGKRRESYQNYLDVLKIDENNSVALQAISELRKQFEDLPPANATRLQIHDESTKSQLAAVAVQKSQFKPKPKSINYDLADLVKPNRVVQNKIFKAAEDLGKNMKNTKGKHPEKEIKQENNNTAIELRLPCNRQLKAGKKLIQEL